MADEYIRKQDVKDALQEKVFHNPTDEFYGAMQVLDELEPADVTPVVHCRDCAKLNRNGYCTRFQNNICGVATSWFMPDDDDFCSYGKRRERSKS